MLRNLPEIIDKLTEKVINSQLDIKFGQFTEKELDAILKKILMKKSCRLWWNASRSLEARKFDDILHWLSSVKHHREMNKKGDLRITKNYKGIDLTAVTAKVYNALLLNCIWPEIKNKKTEEKSEQLSEKLLHNFTDSYNSLNHQRNTSKKSLSNTILSRFLQAIWFLTQRKDWANTFCI